MSTTFSFRCAATALMAALLSAVIPASASASPTTARSAPTSTPTGVDISYPQCGKSLPSGQAWAVVGVGGGRADVYNPCLATQWDYATRLPGGAGQRGAQAYLNTGDPGNTVADWPNPGRPGAYGQRRVPNGTSCTYAAGSRTAGENSIACAYVYGYDMVAGIGPVSGDLAAFRAATGTRLYAQPIWLDVETENTWQSGIYGQAMNVAVLQGMVQAVTDAAAAAGESAPRIGIYSTSYQWGLIAGSPRGAAAGDLANLPVWIPGAASQAGATANCGLPSFTGGRVVMTQWFGGYDGDVSCL